MNLESSNPYENTLFSCCLVVKKDNICEYWLTLKASSIKNSGKGVFASWFFKKNEFVTCYFGIYAEHPSNYAYTFKKINTMPNASNIGFQEEFWFVHRIQHGSGDTVNVCVNESYASRSTEEIGDNSCQIVVIG